MTTTPRNPAAHRPRAAWYAAGTLLAAAAGVGVGHLVAALVSPSASPVLAVGSTVIDATPTPVKEWAVSTFGTSDKPILIASVSVVTLLLAGAIGLLARSRRSLGLALIAALALLAAAAAGLRPTSQPVDLLPGILTAVVGVLAAQWFLGVLDRAGASSADPAAGAGPDRTAHGDGTSGRRTVLAAAAGLGAVAATGGGLGQAFSRTGAAADVVLPAPTTTLEPLPQGLEEMVRGVSSFRTPNDSFYRIDTALVIPRVDPDSWTLTIDGDVDNPFTLTYQELLDLPMIEKRHHPHVRLQRGRRPVRRRSALARGARPHAAGARRGPGQGRPDLQPVRRRRDDHLDAAPGVPRRPRRPRRRRDERRAAARRPRLPGPAGHPRALRLRQCHASG